MRRGPDLFELASAQSGGYLFRMIWGLIVGPIGLALAFDYRNCAIRFFDFAAGWTPGGGISRATPTTVRIIGGVLGVVGVGTLAFSLYKLLLV
jgi:hypothetical protein